MKEINGYKIGDKAYVPYVNGYVKLTIVDFKEVDSVIYAIFDDNTVEDVNVLKKTLDFK